MGVEVGKVKRELKLAELRRCWQKKVGVDVSKVKREVVKKGGS